MGRGKREEAEENSGTAVRKWEQPRLVWETGRRPGWLGGSSGEANKVPKGEVRANPCVKKVGRGDGGGGSGWSSLTSGS